MKQVLFIAALLFTCLFVNAQVENYFYQKGVATLAYCAHPTNTFSEGTYQIDGNSIIVDISYKEGYRTKLRVSMSNGYFNHISVLEDSDFFPSFMAIKTIITTTLKQKDADGKDDVIVTNTENIINKEISEWSGRDWALLVLNLDYFSN